MTCLILNNMRYVLKTTHTETGYQGIISSEVTGRVLHKTKPCRSAESVYYAALVLLQRKS